MFKHTFGIVLIHLYRENLIIHWCQAKLIVSLLKRALGITQFIASVDLHGTLQSEGACMITLSSSLENKDNTTRPPISQQEYKQQK